MLNSTGGFSSSDELEFLATDYGVKVHRRLTLDPDVNLRLYSFVNGSWDVTWEAFTDSCTIQGICGPNSFCTYNNASGRKCSCAQGYKMTNYSDWFYGCEPLWNHSQVTRFLVLPNAEFYGYDRGYFPNYTSKECEEECVKLADCKGFQYKINGDLNQVHDCYHKADLLNGHRSSNFPGDVYIRLPKDIISSFDKPHEETSLLEDNILQRQNSISLFHQYQYLYTV